MKKTTLLKTMLLLCALVAGSSSVWADDTYSRITSTEDLEVGEEYIIVSETNNVAMGTISNDKGQGVSVTISSNTISLSSSSTVNVLTLGGDSEGYTLLGSQDSKYIGYNSGTKLAANSSANTNSYKWTITFSDNNASIANVATTTRLIRGYDSNKDFRAYATSNGSNVQLYKKVTVSGPINPSVTIPTTTIACGATATIGFPEDLITISFESSDPSVATVSDAGVVSGVAAGSATITATWTAIADKYNAGSQEFNVTVVEAIVYNKVTSITQLVAGNKYILVATGNNKAMGAENTKKRAPVDVTITDNSVTIIDEEVAELTLGGTMGAWTFLASDNSEYLAYSGSSNELHTNADGTAAASKWIITADFQLESANVSGRVIKYNAGSPRFACYSSGQQTAVLFVKAGSAEVTSIPATISSAEYATFSSPYALDFSATGITVYTATAGSTSVTLNEVTSGKVPANTPVVLYKAGADGTAINVPVAASADAIAGTNDLLVSDGTVTGGDNIYALASKNDVTGFYKVKDTVTIPSGKCYLTTSAGAPEFLGFSFGDVTAIKGVEAVKAAESNAVFNLAGQRVAQPSKGLYIVNGRKVVIK